MNGWGRNKDTCQNIIGLLSTLALLITKKINLNKEYESLLTRRCNENKNFTTNIELDVGCFRVYERRQSYTRILHSLLPVHLILLQTHIPDMAINAQAPEPGCGVLQYTEKL